MVRYIFVFLLILFLGGCATLYNPATGKNELILINSATEAALGKSAATEFTHQHPLVKNAALQNRVQLIGGRLAQVSDRKDIAYRFAVVEDNTLNATTLPGGFIYINRGLVDILQDDELAFVIGHEIGHSAARHIAKKIQSHMTYQLVLAVAFSGLGNDAGSSAQEITQGIDTIYSLVDLSYSRQDELQADRLGVKYSYRAGFSPYAAVIALGKIKKEEGPHLPLLKYLRTHPYVDERIRALNTSIPELIRKNK